jgi:hypothetical protein
VPATDLDERRVPVDPALSDRRVGGDDDVVLGGDVEMLALYVAMPTAATCGEALGIPKGASRWLIRHPLEPWRHPL